MSHKNKIHLIGCQNDYGFDKCNECGYTFNSHECKCYRHKTNRKLIWK